MVPEQPIRAGPSLSDTPTAAPPRRGLGGGSGVAGEAGGRSCCGTVGVDCCGTVAFPVLQGSGGLSQAVREFKFCKSIRETKLLGMCEGRAAKCHGTSVIEAPSSRLGFEEGGGGSVSGTGTRTWQPSSGRVRSVRSRVLARCRSTGRSKSANKGHERFKRAVADQRRRRRRTERERNKGVRKR